MNKNISNGVKKLFSGIKPTGNIHLGNYLGAIKHWVELQSSYDCFYSIVDLHALTSGISAQELKRNSFDLAVDLLALGIDPKKSIFFKQSDVTGHTELAWIFNTLIPIGELGRMTQFKEKSAGDTANTQNANAGLLTYPVLQAADVLLYQAEYVPVGEDQVQHIELIRIIARKFNNKYVKYFPEAKPLLSHSPRLMSLSYPEKKMSKSLGEASYIAIRDDKDTIAKKIKKAVTDAKGTLNLIELYSYFGDNNNYNQMLTDYKSGKLMNADLKNELTSALVKFLEPIQIKINELDKNPKKVQKILADGAKRAQKIADANMEEIKKLVGLS